MANAQTDRWIRIAGQIRNNAIWTAAWSTLFGFQVAIAMWKTHDVFYPFPLVLWGFFAVFWSYRAVLYLSQLSYAVPLEQTNTFKSKARKLMAYTLCIALISFCFAICLLGSKASGRLYIVAAVGLGTCMVLMVFAIERDVKRLARQFSYPSDERLA